MSRTKYQGFQNKLMQIAPESCFFLTLLSIAEDYNADFSTGRTFDLADALNVSLEKGWLGASDNLMYNDVALLSHLTGCKVAKRTMSAAEFTGYTVLQEEYTAVKWRRGRNTHFRRRAYDVHTNSQTVAKGSIESIYVYKIGG